MNQSDRTPFNGLEDEANPVDILSDLLGTIIHRRWWFLVTASAVILASLLVLFRTPDRYTSEATIVITQQRVPERYVVSTSTTNLTKDLQTMEGEALSRTRLLSLIEEFRLYPKESKRLAPEQLLELIKSYINVEPLAATSAQREADSFRVSFTAENPAVAQEVTSRLASFFILNNVKGRQDQATSTTKFLNDQLGVAQKKLTDLEQSLRDFKMQHLGELPEQQQGNLTILGGLQSQLQSTTSAIARAEQQRVYLESLINTSRAAATRRNGDLLASPKETESTDEGILGAELRLAHLRSDRKALASLRLPNDPELLKKDESIARMESQLQKLKAAKPERERAAETEDASVAQLKGQLEVNRLEVENLTKDEKQLKESIAQYQTRLNQMPVREQQLAGLLRDRDQVQKEYADLLTKEQQSQLATSLEEQQGGQQFRLQEPPSLPTVPSSPKRIKLGLGTGAAGIGIGFVVAFLVDLKKRAFYSEKQVSKQCGLPLVVGIPLFITPSETRKRTRTRTYEWIGGCALTVVVCSAEFVYLKGWDFFARWLT